MAALSSSSVPGVFPPVNFAGRLLADGGTIWSVDPFSAVEQCRELVDNDEDIILDVMICMGDPTVPSEETVDKNAFTNLRRGSTIREGNAGGRSITEAMRAYPDVDFRYLFINEHDVTVALDFRNETTWPL